MTTPKENCLLNLPDCGRKDGEPRCAKCGLDERVRYVSEGASVLAAKMAEAQYWKAHAKELEAKINKAPEPPPAPPSSIDTCLPSHAVGETFQDHPLAPQMVRLPSGSFLMGSANTDKMGHDDERPQHQVSIGYKLAMGRYPVTFEEWDTCVSDGGGVNHQPSDHGWGRGKRPVVNVNWHDVQAYVAWLNRKLGIGATDPHRYRLPTEAEWEYACRAGSLTRWCFGDDEKQLEDYAWFHENSQGKTHPVGQKKPNLWNLFDMHGNVWEWVQDAWVPNYRDAPIDGRSEQRIKVGFFPSLVGEPRGALRGGAWSSSAKSARAANRYDYSRGARDSNIGFRLARTVP